MGRFSLNMGIELVGPFHMGNSHNILNIITILTKSISYTIHGHQLLGLYSLVLDLHTTFTGIIYNNNV